MVISPRPLPKPARRQETIRPVWTLFATHRWRLFDDVMGEAPPQSLLPSASVRCRQARSPQGRGFPAPAALQRPVYSPSCLRQPWQTGLRQNKPAESKLNWLLTLFHTQVILHPTSKPNQPINQKTL